MLRMRRYTGVAGLALVLACGDSGTERAAATQAGTGGAPPAPVDVCSLLTQEEATAILGTSSAAPQQSGPGTCAYTARSGRGEIMLHMLPLAFRSSDEFRAFLVKDTEQMNERMRKAAGDALKPTTVEPAPEAGNAAYYVDPTLVVLKDGRVLSILAGDRKQAVAVAAKAVPRF